MGKYKKRTTIIDKRVWTIFYVSRLPDEAFLHTVLDGSKVVKRNFPYVDNAGVVDVPHLRNAIARIPDSDLSETNKTEVMAKAKKILEDIEQEKVFEKYVSVYALNKADKDEQIVMGVVYEPDETDSQGDTANEKEIRKAAYQFMEEVQKFKVMHKGNKVKVKVLESYVSPADFTIEEQSIKKGSWLLTVRVLDKKIWKAIKDGKLTGFSMAGYAKTN